MSDLSYLAHGRLTRRPDHGTVTRNRFQEGDEIAPGLRAAQALDGVGREARMLRTPAHPALLRSFGAARDRDRP